MTEKIISTNYMNTRELKNLTKSHLIRLLMKQNMEIQMLLQANQQQQPTNDQKPVPAPRTKKPVPLPRKRVKQMVHEYEDNIILPPLEFRDDYKPIRKQTLLQANNQKPVTVKQYNKNKKCIKATNTSNKEVLYFDSVCSAGQHLNMIAGEIRLVCDGKHESAISRRNRCIYIFEYVEENLPVEYIGLISSEKRRQLIEERGYLEWRDKIYDCT